MAPELPPGACYPGQPLSPQPPAAFLSHVSVPRPSLATNLSSSRSSLQRHLLSTDPPSTANLGQRLDMQENHNPLPTKATFSPASSHFIRSSALSRSVPLNADDQSHALDASGRSPVGTDMPTADITQLPIASNSHLYLHSGFYDLLSYAHATGSTLIQSFSPSRPLQCPVNAEIAGLPAQGSQERGPTVQRNKPPAKAKRVRKRFTADMVGHPTDFR